MTDDILSDFADAAEDAETGPSEDSLERAQKLCTQLAEETLHKQKLEEQLRETNKSIYELKTRTIPDFLSEIGVDTIGLPEMNGDVTVATTYKANISADWDEDRRQAAFDYLVQLECQDVIRTSVTYTLGADSFETAVAIHTAISMFAQQMAGTNFEVEVPEPEIKKGVPWNTLTSLVRELTEKGTALDLEKLGATVGPEAKFKERKD